MKKKTSKVRFNFVDLLIAAVVLLLCAVGIYLLFGDRMSANSDSVVIEYTVEVNTVPQELANNVKAGDKVTDTVKAYAIGEVIGFDTEDAYFTAYNTADGEYNEKIPYLDHKKLSVKITASAQETDAKYSINGYEISIGKKVSFRTPNFVGTGYCTAINVVE